jgi:hypothetical protein
MKKLLLMAGIITSGAAFAQKDNDNNITLFRFRQQENIDSFRIKLENLAPIPQENLVSSLQGKYSHSLPNGNGVYLLPQDNMPCIVPGQQHSTMPNIAGPKDRIIPPPQPGHIPNPGRKWKIIPMTKNR